MEVKQSTLGAYQNAPVAEPKLTETVQTTDIPVTTNEPVAEQTAAATEAVVNAQPEVTDNAPVAEQEEVVAFEMPSFEEPAADTTTQQTAPATSWKDAIKEVDRTELLKEAGLDDFTIQFAQHLKNGGSAEDYLTAKAVDWNKVSDEDLLKQQLKAEFPEASKEKIDLFFNRKYSQQELADDDDKAVGEMMIQSEARKLRQQRIEQQAKFQIAQPQSQQAAPQAQPQVDPEAEKAQQETIAFFNKLIQSDQTKTLFNSKRVAIDLGEGVKPVQVSIPNPQQLLDALLKPDLAKRFGRTPQGEPDVQQWQELALFLSNPKQFKTVIRNSSKELAKRDLVDEGRNAQRPAQIVPTQSGQYANYGEAFASGNFKSGKLGDHR